MNQSLSEWTIGSLRADARLMSQVRYQRWIAPDEPPPSAKQIAMVLHALADHTALEQARVWDRMKDGKEDYLWPTSLSIGRWLHAYGDLMQRTELNHE